LFGRAARERRRLESAPLMRVPCCLRNTTSASLRVEAACHFDHGPDDGR
jgi:hypothetical protein